MKTVKKFFDKKISRILIMLAAFMIAAMYMPVSSLAASVSKIDTSRKATLTVTHYAPEEADIETLSGVTSRIYRVASVDENGLYTILDKFNDETGFPIGDINSVSSQEQWDNCISPIMKYINDNGIEPEATGLSDSEGKTYYTDLELGIYLVLSDSIAKDDGYTYSFIDFFVAIPGNEYDESTDTYNWVYDVAASPKKSRAVDPEEHQVYKRWDDTGYESERPDAVTVYIYKDGVQEEEISLSTDNNWQYSWSCEKGHIWSVSEADVDGYTASITESGTAFIIVNTYNPPENPSSPPDDDGDNGGGDNDGGEEVETPDDDEDVDIVENDDNETVEQDDIDNNELDNSEDVDNTESEDSEGGLPAVLGAIRKLITDGPAVLGARRLPQTGQLWWPLPILVIGGILLIGFGIRLRKKQ